MRPPPSQWVKRSRKVRNTMGKQQEALLRGCSKEDNDELLKVKEIIVLGQAKDGFSESKGCKEVMLKQATKSNHFLQF